MSESSTSGRRRPVSDVLPGSICLGCILGWVSFAWNGTDYAFGAPVEAGSMVRLLSQLGIAFSFAGTAVASGRSDSSGGHRVLHLSSAAFAIAVVLIAWFAPGLTRDPLAFLTGVAQGLLMSAWLVRYRSDLPSMALMMAAASAIHSQLFLAAWLFDVPVIRAVSAMLPLVAAALLLVPAKPAPAQAVEAAPTLHTPAMSDLLALLLPVACLLVCKFAFGFVSYGQSVADAQTTYFLTAASVAIVLAVFLFGLPRHQTLFICLVVAMCACICLSLAFPYGPAALSTVVYCTGWFFNLYLLSWFAQPHALDHLIPLRASLAGWASVYAITAVANSVTLFLADQIRFVVALVLTVASLVIAFAELTNRVGKTAAAPLSNGSGKEPVAAPVAVFTSVEERVEDLSTTYGVTESERHVLLLLAQGFSLRQISDKLCISENTAKFHRHNVYQKLGVGSKDELIALVYEGSNVQVEA